MKAVFIDGTNLHHMGHNMGIARFNLFALNKLLVEDIGTIKELIGPPMVTVTPQMGKGALARAFEAVGFEAVKTVTDNSLDDQLIIQRINSLDPEKVKEIILVSSDQDYAQALRTKAQEGVKVYWMCMPDNGTGLSMVSPRLQSMLGPEFELISILAYKNAIMGVPKKLVQTKPVVPIRSLRIELSGARSNKEYLRLVAQINLWLQGRPHIKYKIES